MFTKRQVFWLTPFFAAFPPVWGSGTIAKNTFGANSIGKCPRITLGSLLIPEIESGNRIRGKGRLFKVNAINLFDKINSVLITKHPKIIKKKLSGELQFFYLKIAYIYENLNCHKVYRQFF
jgi:hypothetical protein